MNSNRIIVVGVVVSLVLSVYATITPGTPGQDGKDGVGAIPGTSLPDKHDVAGINYEYQRSVIRSGTSTVCSLPMPSATSTYQASLDVRTGTGTALTVYIARGAGNNATTTRVYTESVASGARYTVDASTTAPVIGGGFLNFNLKGGANDVPFRSADAPIGTCQAIFRVLN